MGRISQCNTSIAERRAIVPRLAAFLNIRLAKGPDAADSRRISFGRAYSARKTMLNVGLLDATPSPRYRGQAPRLSDSAISRGRACGHSTHKSRCHEPFEPGDA